MLTTRVEVPGHRVAQLGPVLWCRFGVGITVATGVSQWDDQSGNGNHLKQSTTNAQPALQADNSILFDGTSDFLKATAFTLNQPETVYLLGRQVSWTSADTLWDGNANALMRCFQTGAAPALQIQASTQTASNSGLAVNTYGVLCAVYNGASSLFQVNNNAAATGDAGVNGAAGFTLGAQGDGLGTWSNIQTMEVIVFPAAHDSATRALVTAYLARIGSLSI